jgi:cell division septation protein DedD
MLRRGLLALVVAAGLFAGSVGAGFILASVALRHSAGAGLVAAPSVPRPADQFGSPTVTPGPTAVTTGSPDDHTAGVAGNAPAAAPLPPAARAVPNAPAARPSPVVSPGPYLRPSAPAGVTATAAAGGGATPAPPAPVTPAPGGVATAPQPAPQPAPVVQPSATAPVTPTASAPEQTLPPGATPIAPAAPAVAPGTRYHVQVGSFDERQNADALAIRLRAGGYAATVTNGPPYRVWVGGYLDPVTAQRLADGLKNLGLTPELVTQ